ncbi:LCP family protein [Paenibacillus sp. 23TSA30-6]|uniref:LCP family protein n=1 Tax=Paenibacillus sp. 23TSA30-6 TaxID=2546104 RepID=UPI001787D899|nr:LCP family protein [Paenibacillus sp. 23TSA30-6]MBE0338598.1 LytR family transcriptional regulator [Paenibacillus sp. 23TSA30-6]
MTSRTKRTIWSVLAVIIVAIVGFAVYYFSSIYNQLDNLHKEGANSPFKNVTQVDQVRTPDPPKWEGTDPVNILLMGVDGRGIQKGEVPRSDSMMVVSLDPVKKKIHLFSILRDTYVDIPGYNKSRINTAITHGPNTAMKAAGDLLGIPVQYYVYTDFQGFIKLVDAVGGIDLEVEKDMHYTSNADKHEYDIDLKKGMQHLGGKEALQYVRFRHDAMSDFSRSGRQRAFLEAIAQKMQSTTSIANLPSILQQVNPFIDTNLSVNDMWRLANVGYQSNFAGSEQVPPMKLLGEENVGGAQVLTVRDPEELKKYVQDIFNNPPVQTQEQNKDQNKTKQPDSASSSKTDKASFTGGSNTSSNAAATQSTTKTGQKEL